MELEYMTRREHEEFARRMDTENQRRDDENKRQNRRLEQLETAINKISDLTVSVEKMAVSISTMATEIKQQGARLEAIEQKPGKRWETLVGDIIKLLLAALIGFGLAKLGL